MQKNKNSSACTYLVAVKNRNDGKCRKLIFSNAKTFILQAKSEGGDGTRTASMAFALEIPIHGTEKGQCIQDPVIG